MNFESHIAVQNAYTGWALSTRWERPLAVTLTMKQAIELETGLWEYLNRRKARGAILYFLNELDRRCWPKIRGQRSGKTKRFVVFEGDANVRWHYHLLIDCPSHVQPAVFATWIREIWFKAIWGYKQIDIQPADAGWLDYMLKFETKEYYCDAVEVDACHGLSGEKL